MSVVPTSPPGSSAPAVPGARLASAVRLVHHLREALRHLVLAHEEERDRVRRDLHDGLEPHLADLAQGLDALAHERWAADPSLGNQLEEMAVEAEQLLADVRRVVAELHPDASPRRPGHGPRALPHQEPAPPRRVRPR